MIDDNVVVAAVRAIGPGRRKVHAADAKLELDRIDDAQTAMKTVLEIMPQYTVKEADRIYAYRLDEDRQRILDDLRKAGLPEG